MGHSLKQRIVFKQCNTCSTEWENLEFFYLDKDIILSGYLVHHTDPGKGLLLFSHNSSLCQSTLAVKIEEFQFFLGQGVQLEPLEMQGEHCPDLCADKNNLSPCHNLSCKGNSIRQLIQKVKNKSF